MKKRFPKKGHLVKTWEGVKTITGFAGPHCLEGFRLLLTDGREWADWEDVTNGVDWNVLLNDGSRLHLVWNEEEGYWERKKGKGDCPAATAFSKAAELRWKRREAKKRMNNKEVK